MIYYESAIFINFFSCIPEEITTVEVIMDGPILRKPTVITGHRGAMPIPTERASSLIQYCISVALAIFIHPCFVSELFFTFSFAIKLCNFALSAKCNL